MLHGRLDFDDLTSPIDMIDGGFSVGGSFVLPVRHRMLRTDLLENDDRIVLITRERFQDDPGGMEVAVGVPAAVIEDSIGNLDDYLLDFAVLTIDRRRRTVAYRASPMISIPAYLIADVRGVSLDWDYARLLGGRDVEIVWENALAQIAGFSTYGPTTIVEGLYRATAGATMTVGSDGIRIALPEGVEHDGPQDPAPGVDIGARLVDTVASIIGARAIDPARTALELSGGMDSALTAIAAADAMGPGLLSIGAQFSGEMGDAQRARRVLLCQRGAFDDLSVPAERLAPFSLASHRRVRFGVMPEDENYPEMFEAIFSVLQAAGIDTVISGLGGDELYIAYDGEEGAPNKDVRPCAFLTTTGLAIAERARSRHPVGWLQETCWSGAASQAQRVLRYGLWPVHPYHTPELARFMSRLPRHHRRDRHLLRATLTTLLGNPVFETEYLKETFKPVALRGIVENRAYLIDLVERSPLARHPDIDDAAILATLSGDIATLDRDTYNALFRVLKVFCFFQSGNQGATTTHGLPDAEQARVASALDAKPPA